MIHRLNIMRRFRMSIIYTKGNTPVNYEPFFVRIYDIRRYFERCTITSRMNVFTRTLVSLGR